MPLAKVDKAKPINLLVRRGEWAQYVLIRPALKPRSDGATDKIPGLQHRSPWPCGCGVRGLLPTMKLQPAQVP